VIEDHFDIAYELNRTLEARGKTKELELLARDQPQAGHTSFTRQQEPLGLGHAVWCARELVGDEPFAVLLPDMLSRGSVEQMIAAYEQHGGNIIAVEEVPEDQTHQYGIVSVGRNSAGPSRSPAWWRSPSRAPRRRTTSSPAATSCSPRSSRCSPPRSAAPATRSSSRIP
jgi:UTP-glucose-1-phosphate uridylyltransferase